MSDTETGALLAAVNGLVPHYPDDAALILRQTLAALLGAELPAYVAKQPAHVPGKPQAIEIAGLPRQSPDTRMPPDIPKAAPRKGRASNGPGAVLSPEWLELRQQVTVAMGQRQMDMARLAEATGFAVSTIEIAMTRRSPPSRPILAALRVWLADPGEAQAEEPPQAPGGSNGASRPPAAPVAIVAPAPAQAVAVPELALPRPAPFRLGADTDVGARPSAQ